MRDKHTFSKSYTERKKAVLKALHREEELEQKNKLCFFTRTPIRIMASIAILSVLTVSVYAAVQWIDFQMDQNGDEVRIHASLNETDNNTEKTLRSWRAENGEISVSLNIPDLPADMDKDLTANGKYDSTDTSRSMTINGIDLRRSDLNELIYGTTNTKQLDVGGKSMYIVEKGEANYYNRIAYIVFDEDELVLKLWVSTGITDTELTALASTMTLEYTSNSLLAIPIINELNDTANDDIPEIIVRPDNPIYETDLIEIGQSIRDDNGYYTLTVNNVNIYDNINMLDSNCILHKDFVNRFIDEFGKLIPYNRTQVISNLEEGNQITKQFGETVSVTKKLYVITLTMDDLSMDNISEENRDLALQSWVNSYILGGYTVKDGKLEMIDFSAVVDSQPGEHACTREIVYREYLGGNQWRIAYLIDEDFAQSNLVLKDDVSKIAIKIQ